MLRTKRDLKGKIIFSIWNWQNLSDYKKGGQMAADRTNEGGRQS